MGTIGSDSRAKTDIGSRFFLDLTGQKRGGTGFPGIESIGTLSSDTPQVGIFGSEIRDSKLERRGKAEVFLGSSGDARGISGRPKKKGSLPEEAFTSLVPNQIICPEECRPRPPGQGKTDNILNFQPKEPIHASWSGPPNY